MLLASVSCVNLIWREAARRGLRNCRTGTYKTDQIRPITTKPRLLLRAAHLDTSRRHARHEEATDACSRRGLSEVKPLRVSEKDRSLDGAAERE